MGCAPGSRTHAADSPVVYWLVITEEGLQISCLLSRLCPRLDGVRTPRDWAKSFFMIVSIFVSPVLVHAVALDVTQFVQ
jgi:hypothetical protein